MFCLVSVIAHAQCVSGDCDNGYGVAFFPEKGKARYSGRFHNQKPHGFGTAEYGDGSVYEGEWRNGKWHGQGTMTLASGTKLKGTWQDSRFIGSDAAFALDQKPIPRPNSATTPTPKPTTVPTPVNDTIPNSTSDIRPNTEPNTEPNTQQTPTESDEEDEEEKINPISTPIPKPVPPLSMPSTPAKTQESLLATVQYGKPKSEVWVMSVGVAAYKNPRIALKYPQSDALEMQGLWRGPEGGSLDYDHIMVLTNDHATRRNILDSMRALFSRAKENDMVIFYFSGHGLKGAFLPHDYDDNDVRIDYTEVNDLLAACPAKHKLVIGDACFVGSLWASKSIEPEVKQTQEEKKESFLRQLSKTAPGTAFLLSSSADEESFEISSYGRSIFTHYVLEGLKGAANANGDDIITVTELFEYAELNVRTLAAKVKKEQTPMLRGIFDPNMPVAMKRQ
ncbi:MAG: caspase family protein [Saprospiraceae bacterium]|nr:caspase family protein [Saprospiraceae bacterium]